MYVGAVVLYDVPAIPVQIQDSRFKIQDSVFLPYRFNSRFKIQDSVLRCSICHTGSFQDSRFKIQDSVLRQ